MRDSPALAAGLLAVMVLAGCAHGTPSPSGLHVESISPSDGQTGVQTSASVTVTFSKDVYPGSVTGSRSILVVDSSNVLQRGVFSVAGNVVTFNPSGGFAADTTYGVAVREFVCDMDGGSLKYPKAAVFSTGASVSEIAGFPPFEEYPDAPDMARIKGWAVSGDAEISGSEGAATPWLNVNVRNLSSGGPGLSVKAGGDGSFLAVMAGGAIGDSVEVCISDESTGKSGPRGMLVLEKAPEWKAMAPAGTAPEPMFGQSAVFDPQGARMIVFGGATNQTGFVTVSGKIYALGLASPGFESWSEISPSGSAPAARYGHSAVYDAVNGRMIVFGGNNGLLGVFSDVWSLSLSPGSEAWTAVSPSGTPPAARAFHCAVFDAGRGRMIVFGGEDAGFLAPQRFSDVWALEFIPSPAWVKIEASSPLDSLGGLVSFPPRSGAAHAFQASQGRMITAFGFASVSGVPVPLWDSYALAFDAAGAAWSALSSPPTETGRGYMPGVCDQARDRFYAFGGRSASAAYDGLYMLDLGSGEWSEPEIPAGTPPQARSEHSAVWDGLNGRMLIFGGRAGLNGSLFNDLHSLTME